MIDDILFYALLLVVLLWLAWYWLGPRRRPTTDHTTPKPAQPTQTCSSAPKPFPGLTHKPRCVTCEQGSAPGDHAPPAPRPLSPSPHGRPRQVDTSGHFCPHPACRYHGWVRRGNIRANGHPSGKPWRQLQCMACRTYFLETHGIPLHGKHVPAERLVWAVGALAEGLGIRAVARVFEMHPNTVLQWLVEAADHAAALSRYFLHDVHVSQVQLDELFALLSAVKAGEVSKAEILQPVSRSPHWVWVALDPVTKLLLALDIGDHTLEMAQRIVHGVTQILAPGCVPLFLTDGFKEYTTALLTHFGSWVRPPRRQAQGPMPKPRWMPLPQLLYAQVVKSYRRRRWSARHDPVQTGGGYAPAAGSVSRVL